MSRRDCVTRSGGIVGGLLPLIPIVTSEAWPLLEPGTKKL